MQIVSRLELVSAIRSCFDRDMNGWNKNFYLSLKFTFSLFIKAEKLSLVHLIDCDALINFICIHIDIQNESWNFQVFLNIVFYLIEILYESFQFMLQIFLNIHQVYAES